MVPLTENRREIFGSWDYHHPHTPPHASPGGFINLEQVDLYAVHRRHLCIPMQKGGRGAVSRRHHPPSNRTIMQSRRPDHQTWYVLGWVAIFTIAAALQQLRDRLDRLDDDLH